LSPPRRKIAVDLDELRELQATGATVREMAKALKVSADTVRRRLRELGLEAARQGRGARCSLVGCQREPFHRGLCCVCFWQGYRAAFLERCTPGGGAT
jgi:excisionase family DNA binding protein